MTLVNCFFIILVINCFINVINFTNQDWEKMGKKTQKVRKNILRETKTKLKK